MTPSQKKKYQKRNYEKHVENIIETSDEYETVSDYEKARRKNMKTRDKIVAIKPVSEMDCKEWSSYCSVNNKTYIEKLVSDGKYKDKKEYYRIKKREYRARKKAEKKAVEATLSK